MIAPHLALCLAVLATSTVSTPVSAQSALLDARTMTVPRAAVRSGPTPRLLFPGLGDVVDRWQCLLGVDVVPDALVRINRNTGNAAPLGGVGNDVVAGLAWDPNQSILYGTSTRTDELLILDTVTGATTTVGSFGRGVSLMHGLGYDSRNDVLYGITNQQTNALYRIDVNTGTATWVGNHGRPLLSGLAFDSVRGVMYASDAGSQELYTIDLTTANVTLVGPFNAPQAFQPGVGLGFHPDVGLYASDNRASAGVDDLLFEIDARTGQATLVGALHTGNVLGLAIAPCAHPRPIVWATPLFPQVMVLAPGMAVTRPVVLRF